MAEKKLPEPKVVKFVEPVIDKRTLGSEFKQKAKVITETLVSLDKDQLEDLDKELNSNGLVNAKKKFVQAQNNMFYF